MNASGRRLPLFHSCQEQVSKRTEVSVTESKVTRGQDCIDGTTDLDWRSGCHRTGQWGTLYTTHGKYRFGPIRPRLQHRTRDPTDAAGKKRTTSNACCSVPLFHDQGTCSCTFLVASASRRIARFSQDGASIFGVERKMSTKRRTIVVSTIETRGTRFILL